MALDAAAEAALKASLKTAFTNAVGTDDSFDTIAGDLAAAIVVLAKKGEVVNVSAGAVTIPVT